MINYRREGNYEKYGLFVFGIALLTGCSVGEQQVEKVPVTENVGAYTQVYKQQIFENGEYSESDISVEDDERKAAYDALQDYRSSISDEKEILSALDIVDEFFINNNTMQNTRKDWLNTRRKFIKNNLTI